MGRERLGAAKPQLCPPHLVTRRYRWEFEKPRVRHARGSTRHGSAPGGSSRRWHRAGQGLIPAPTPPPKANPDAEPSPCATSAASSVSGHLSVPRIQAGVLPLHGPPPRTKVTAVKQRQPRPARAPVGGPARGKPLLQAGRHPRAPRSPPGAWAPARAVSPAWASRAWGCVSAVWTRGDACLRVWTACPWGCVYAAHPRQSPVSARVAGSSDGRHISLTPRGTGAPPAPGWPHWAVPRSAGRFGEEACDARQSPVCPLGRC